MLQAGDGVSSAGQEAVLQELIAALEAREEAKLQLAAAQQVCRCQRC